MPWLWWALRQLRSNNVATRVKAARKLGVIRNAKAISPLVAALSGESDPGFRVHDAVAEALSRFGGEALPPLLTALTSNQQPVRFYAAQILGDIGDPAAVASLLARVDDDNKGVRCTAIRALGKLRDSRSLPRLTEAVNDRDQDVRCEAIRALAKLGDASSLPTLVLASEDASEPVSTSALSALTWFDDPQARRVLDQRRERFRARAHPKAEAEESTRCQWCGKDIARGASVVVGQRLSSYSSIVFCSDECRNSIDLCCKRCKQPLPVAGVGAKFEEICNLYCNNCAPVREREFSVGQALMNELRG